MSARPTSNRSARKWTHHDTALWHTCDILNKVRQKQVSALPLLSVSFGLQLGGRAERVVASGRFRRAAWTAISDGSYMRNESVFVATGGAGIALTAAFLGGRAIGNARRKRRARDEAMPRWVRAEPGLIHVSTHGFYFQSSTGLVSWDWGSIDVIQVTAPGTVQMDGRSSDGPVKWLINSIWAELIFVLWAADRNPHHSQLISESWLPVEWKAWAASQGRAPARVTWSKSSSGN